MNVIKFLITIFIFRNVKFDCTVIKTTKKHTNFLKYFSRQILFKTFILIYGLDAFCLILINSLSLTIMFELQYRKRGRSHL